MCEAKLNIEAIADGTELARYRTSREERVLLGYQRADGTQVVDAPASMRGRVYGVDRGVTDGHMLQAFIEDYVSQASLFDSCPMSGEALQEVLDDTDAEAVDRLLAELD